MRYLLMSKSNQARKRCNIVHLLNVLHNSSLRQAVCDVTRASNQNRLPSA